jgi:hypothetical protein
MTDHSDEPRFRAPSHHRKLWAALLAGPLAWSLGLTLKYFVVPFSCGSMNPIPTHLISAATLVITLLGTWLAWQLWVDSGKQWPDESGLPVVRTRFMAVMSLMSGALFALAIIAQWLTAAFLNPCMSI